MEIYLLSLLLTNSAWASHFLRVIFLSIKYSPNMPLRGLNEIYVKLLAHSRCSNYSGLFFFFF